MRGIFIKFPCSMIKFNFKKRQFPHNGSFGIKASLNEKAALGTFCREVKRT